MTSTLFTLLAGLLLIAGASWGYRIWAAPNLVGASTAAKVLLGVMVVTVMVAIGIPFWWFDTDQSFSWDLPPLASRMLAAAGLSFAVLGILVLRHPSHRRVRLVLVMLEAYLALLAVVMVASHLDRFDFGQLISYAFLLVAFGMTSLATYFLIRQPVVSADDARDLAPSSTTSRVVLTVTAFTTLAWGLALFITDSGPSELVWAWPGDLLSSRLIGVMLVAIGVGCVYALPRADTARLMEIATLVYAVGLAAASLWRSVLDKPVKPVKPAYVGAFAGIAVLCATALIVDRWASPAPAARAAT